MKATSSVSSCLSFFRTPLANAVRAAVFTVALFAGIASATAAMSPGRVTIGNVTPEVSVTAPDGTKTPYTPGMTLGTGYTIETSGDGAASLFFSNGVHVYIQPSAVVRLDLYEVAGTEAAGDYQNISKETGFSNTKITVVRGEATIEANGLRAPVSSLVASTSYIRASVSGANAAFSLNHSDSVGVLSNVSGPVKAKDISKSTSGVESVIDQNQAFVVRKSSPNPEIVALSAADSSKIKAIIANGGGVQAEPTTQVNASDRPTPPKVTPIDNSIITTSPNGEGSRL